ncbi:MAG TPA: molybdopterin-binding protein [Firmicutes bacterium]|nr:molybdopterin-binding protein [Bacillota bacterium]
MKISYFETEKSVGKIICHDITKIEKGSFKGARFKKGHRITKEDVPVLLDLGKKHIYSIELEPGDLHEDDAGEKIAQLLAGSGLQLEGPSEGRLNLVSLQRGLLKVDIEQVKALNSIPDVIVSTIHTNSPVDAGEKVAGIKVIPLVVSEKIIRQVEQACPPDCPPINVLPYRKVKLGVIITGYEIKQGRIKDGFAPVIKEKAAYYGLDEPPVIYVEDDAPWIASCIKQLLEKGCQMVIVTGGMSVDPDDVTPTGIKMAGAKLVKYGAPVLPGAMFMLAYLGETPVIGLPACAMYFRSTVLDVLLPRILAGEKISARHIAELGHGGLCRGCSSCRFPNCSFGKGGY